MAGKVDYSGLQQSQTMLEKAKLMESGAISKGLEEGFKPLQEHFENVAKKEEEREKQLKIDQGNAIEFMQDMADTSGLLGKYEPVIADLAKDVKFKLNEIAQDESLNSYEKAARMKEETDAFNKRASRFARDQEFATAWNEAIGKGTLSNAINTSGEDYQIASAVAGGNYTVNKDGTYTIGFKSKGEDGVETTKDITFDSKRLREIYLPNKQVSAAEVSSTLGELGKAAKTKEQLEQGLQDFATEIGDVKTGIELLTDGFSSTYKSPMALEDAFNNCVDGVNPNTKKSCQLKTDDMKGKEWKDLDENTKLDWLRKEAIRVGGRIAKMTFLEKIPPPIKLGDSEVMALETHDSIKEMIEGEDFGTMEGSTINGWLVGATEYDKATGKAKFTLVKPDDEMTIESPDARTKEGQKWLANHLLSSHTASDRRKTLAAYNRMWAKDEKPGEGCPNGFEKNANGECVEIKKEENEEKNESDAQTEVEGLFKENVYPDIVKNADETVLTSMKNPSNKGMTELKKKIGLKPSRHLGDDVVNRIRDYYNGEYSEKNVREAMWDTNKAGEDLAGNIFGRKRYNQSLRDADSLEKENVKLRETLELASTKIFTDSERASFFKKNNVTDKEKKQLTGYGIIDYLGNVSAKDIAYLRYMKANKIKDFETALALIDENVRSKIKN